MSEYNLVVINWA